MNKLINKGDKIKTSVSDSTLVLKVEGDNALLFTGSQFIVAHGIQKENDKFFWNYGNYHNELPDNLFKNESQKNLEDENDWELELGKNFTYKRFQEYVQNRMSIITKDDSGEYEIYGDTQPLQEFGIMTEEETMRHIYDNNLFEKMDEIIDKSVVYIYPSFKEPEEEYEDEFEGNLEDEDDWELER